MISSEPSPCSLPVVDDLHQVPALLGVQLLGPPSSSRLSTRVRSRLLIRRALSRPRHGAVARSANRRGARLVEHGENPSGRYAVWPRARRPTRILPTPVGPPISTWWLSRIQAQVVSVWNRPQSRPRGVPQWSASSTTAFCRNLAKLEVAGRAACCRPRRDLAVDQQTEPALRATPRH